MKDRFKFRVYDKTINKMQYNCGLGFEGNQLVEDVDCKIMQSTGLKDKNGILVYENDIVEFIMDHKKYVGIVFFNEENTAFEIYFKTKGSWCIFVKLFECYILEVLGNEFENPELLENN